MRKSVGDEPVMDRLSMAPLTAAMAYITVWLGDTARRKHAGFQKLIIIFDFSVAQQFLSIRGGSGAGL